MYLALLDEFKCAANNCPNDCCHGWNIHVDDETRAGWQNLPASKFQKEMLESLEFGNEEFTLQRDSSGACHFLKTGLCRIQNKFGHEVLPKTCREYPRVTVGRENQPVKSAFMSCPEVVRLMINNGTDRSVPLFKQQQSIDVSSLREDPLQVEKLLDVLNNKLLSANNIPAGEAIFTIGNIFLQLINPSSGRRMIGQLEEMCLAEQVLEDYLGQNRKLFRNRRLQANRSKAGEYWKLTVNTCRVLKMAPYHVLWDSTCSEWQSEGLVNTDPSRVYSIISGLKSQSEGLADDVTADLKKYFQLKLVNHGFPLACHEGKMQHVLLECLISLSQILLLLYLLKQAHQLNKESLSEVIYKVERSLVHNDHLEQKLLEYGNFDGFEDYLRSFLVLL